MPLQLTHFWRENELFSCCLLVIWCQSKEWKLIADGDGAVPSWWARPLLLWFGPQWVARFQLLSPEMFQTMFVFHPVILHMFHKDLFLSSLSPQGTVHFRWDEESTKFKHMLSRVSSEIRLMKISWLSWNSWGKKHHVDRTSKGPSGDSPIVANDRPLASIVSVKTSFKMLI